MATWKKWTSTVLVNGQPEPNVEVHVYEPGTTNEITVYEDEGVTPITQPILTDSQGRYAFFVDVDTYPEIRLFLEKDGVDFSEANEDLDGVPVPGASAAAGTFLALSDTPSSYVGRGGDVVLVKTTEDGIETQPWPVTGTILNFFLSDDAADIGSYYYMYPTESGDGYSELTSPSLSTGDDQLLWSFVTEAGEPGVEVLALGAYTATLFLRKSGNKDVRVYWKLFKRDSGGTETEILQSAVSDYLTADNSQYLISAYLNEDQVLDPTDRLVLKLFANVSGTGTDVTVTLTMEGDYDSRLTINVLSSAFNLDRLSDVTVSSPANNDLLAYDSGSGKWINQTAAEAGVLANVVEDTTPQLGGDLDAQGHAINNVSSVLGMVNVKGYGAAGDGTTDDTAAITNAIAALPASGGIVVFPPGKYRITSTITMNKRGMLLGVGRLEDETATASVEILKDGNFTGLVIAAPSVTVQGIVVRGATGNGGIGIHIQANSVTLRDTAAVDHGDVGIRIGLDGTGNCNSWRLDNVTARNNGSHGIYINSNIGGAPNANAGIATHVFCYGNGGDGFRIGNADVNNLIGVVTEGNSGAGLRFAADATYNTAWNPHSEGNTGDQIVFDSDSSYNWVIGSINTVPVDNGSFNLVLRPVSTGIPFSQPLLLGGSKKRRSLTPCLGVEGSVPGIYLWETDASANYRLWSLYAQSGYLHGQVSTDDESTHVDWLLVKRTGTTISYVKVQGDLFHVATDIRIDGTTSTSATAGSATLPSNPAGFLKINIEGNDYKLPYYNV